MDTTPQEDREREHILDWGGCWLERPDCTNVNCPRGPAARELRNRIRRDRCPACQGQGTVGGEFTEEICPLGCESARLLVRDVADEEAPFSWLAPADDPG